MMNQTRRPAEITRYRDSADDFLRRAALGRVAIRQPCDGRLGFSPDVGRGDGVPPFALARSTNADAERRRDKQETRQLNTLLKRGVRETRRTLPVVWGKKYFRGESNILDGRAAARQSSLGGHQS